MEMAPAASLDDWDAMVDTNVKGLLYVTRACLPGMVARNRGHIINIGSTAAEFPYPGGNVYGATKAFVYQFSLNLRSDLLGTAVRVTDIEPGMCSGTEFSTVRFKGDADKAAAVYANTATSALTADDIADAVAYASSRPAHVNINSMQVRICDTELCALTDSFSLRRAAHAGLPGFRPAGSEAPLDRGRSVHTILSIIRLVR